MHDKFNKIGCNVLNYGLNSCLRAFSQEILEESRLSVVLDKSYESVATDQLLKIDYFILMRRILRTVARIAGKDSILDGGHTG